jgi:hypothetical protein
MGDWQSWSNARGTARELPKSGEKDCVLCLDQPTDDLERCKCPVFPRHGSAIVDMPCGINDNGTVYLGACEAKSGWLYLDVKRKYQNYQMKGKAILLIKGCVSVTRVTRRWHFRSGEALHGVQDDIDVRCFGDAWVPASQAICVLLLALLHSLGFYSSQHEFGRAGHLICFFTFHLRVVTGGCMSWDGWGTRAWLARPG